MHVPIVAQWRQQTDESHRPANEPPRIPRLVNIHPRRRDVRRVAKERQPHILDVQIVEGLVDGAVELMALGDVSTVLP